MEACKYFTCAHCIERVPVSVRQALARTVSITLLNGATKTMTVGIDSIFREMVVTARGLGGAIWEVRHRLNQCYTNNLLSES